MKAQIVVQLEAVELQARGPLTVDLETVLPIQRWLWKGTGDREVGNLFGFSVYEVSDEETLRDQFLSAVDVAKSGFSEMRFFYGVCEDVTGPAPF